MTEADDPSPHLPAEPVPDRRAEKSGPYYGSRQGDPDVLLQAEKSRPSILMAAAIAVLVVLGLFILGVLIR